MPENSLVRSRRRFLAGAAGSLAALPLAPSLSAANVNAGESGEGATANEAPLGATPDAGESGTTAARTASLLQQQNKGPVKVISSFNGLGATRRAYDMIRRGDDVLDAVIAGVNLVEDDPGDHTVGLGGLPNEDGVVELDAACMHGPTHRAGAVAALRNIRNPSKVAHLVLQQTDHVLLVGEGALRFARAQGFAEEDLLTDTSRKIWLYWKQTLSDKDDWLPPPDDELDPEVARFFKRPTGTIHCAGLDAAGDLSCVTSTSGLFFKLPGRVGDSPIVGAGLYVDNLIGSCGSTGRGEANLKNLCCFAAVELMRSGMPPAEAGLEVLRRVKKHTESRLLDDDGRPKFNLQFYLLNKDGDHAGVAMWGPAKFAITDENGSRHEPSATLYEKEKTA